MAYNPWPGVETRRRRMAERAADDPVKLARAARIIRTALERERITVADLVTPQGGEHRA